MSQSKSKGEIATVVIVAVVDATPTCYVQVHSNLSTIAFANFAVPTVRVSLVVIAGIE